MTTNRKNLNGSQSSEAVSKPVKLSRGQMKALRGGGFPTIMTCDFAEAIYNATCDRYGNWSSQCTSTYDQLHCFCQNCGEAIA